MRIIQAQPKLTETASEVLVRGHEDRWQVAGGFFEVSDNKASVLADAISGGPGA